MKHILTSVAIAAAATTGAHAAPVSFFAEDLTPGGNLTAAVEAEQTSFLSGLTGVGVEDFESSSLPTIEFAGSSGTIDAELSGSANIDGFSSGGRFSTSGSRFVETSGGGDFTISFSTSIAAFGFYGTDLGDVNNSLVLQLTKVGGGTVDLAVGNDTNAPSGALLFFGFIDAVDSYTSISFLNQPGGSDVFGFDDLIIGDIGQVVTPPTTPPTTPPNPSAVPLPAAGFLLLGALGGMGLTRRRKS